MRDNLELGRGWNKGQDSRVVLECAACGEEIKRHRSQIRSAVAFCSPRCKGEGMSLGLTQPMRAGTGTDELTKYYKRKYYKYRATDKQAGAELPDYSVWELVQRLRGHKCRYCGTRGNLGLDRIDTSKGHTKANTLVACDLCNMTRGNRFSTEEMVLLGQTIREIRSERAE